MQLPTVINHLADVTDVIHINMAMQLKLVELHFGNEHIIVSYCVKSFDQSAPFINCGFAQKVTLLAMYLPNSQLMRTHNTYKCI